jgi:aspartyl-tRNA(Asn)/glutamyl-tRNA(Gln) amidotransferase subunit A
MSAAAGPRATAAARTEEALARIAVSQDLLHAFITVSPETALAEARAADRRAAVGASLGPLDGTLVAIKDCIDVAGIRCTRGSAFFADRIAQADASVVTRLRDAGAVILGKTNLHEFAFGATSQNAFFGSCRNPWDLDRIPGGSSGGSAAALAAGLAEAALGTDTGSSIRMPAALTGVCGLRPTHGTIPDGGVFPVSPPLDTVGPMARSVEMLASMLGIMADASAGFERAEDRLDAEITGLRIAVPDDFYFAEADPEVATMALDAARILEAAGAKLVSAAIVGASEVQEHQARLLICDAADLHRERLATEPEKFSEGVRTRMLPGLTLRGVDYAHSLRWLEEWRRRVESFFRDTADLMLTPAVPTVAPVVGDDHNLATVTRHISRFAWTWPAAACPSLVVPCGFVDGLPVGLQLAGSRHADLTLLGAGAVYQRATDWHTVVPPALW